MLDVDKKSSVREVQLYITPTEAAAFRKELDRLLATPEANEHSHIYSDDMNCEFSFSIITENKLKNIQAYTKLEQQVLTGKP
jgi:hypothetical protein